MRKLRSRAGQWQRQATHPSCSGGVLICASAINKEAYVSVIFMWFPLILRLGCHLTFLPFDYLGHLPLQPGFVMERHWWEDCSYLNVLVVPERELTGGGRVHIWKPTFCTFKNVLCVLSRSWSWLTLNHSRPVIFCLLAEVGLNIIPIAISL